MPFELMREEKRAYQRREAEPRAELRQSGRIRFNANATENFLGDIKHVILGYDREAGEIALVPTNDENDSRGKVFELKVVGETKRSIAAKSFFNTFQIAIPKNGIDNITPEVREVPSLGKIIVLPLRQAVEQALQEAAPTRETDADTNANADKQSSAKSRK